MKATLVSLSQSKLAAEAGRPSLPPELLASVAARYSRNDEGLEAILSSVNTDDEHGSVAGILKFATDFGHRSIEDLAPIAIFMDGLSLFTVFKLFYQLEVGAGQETSTRYVKFDNGGIFPAARCAITEHESLPPHVAKGVELYQKLCTFWTRLSLERPELLKLPPRLVEQDAAGELKAGQVIARLRRNFVFDRARYPLPMTLLTNVMLVLPARGWVDLCADLLSSALPEHQELGAHIREELRLVVPHLIKHACPMTNRTAAQMADFQGSQAASHSEFYSDIYERNRGDLTSLEMWNPIGIPVAYSDHDFKGHKNRYLPLSQTIQRTTVRAVIRNMAMAEMRDLNRHRPGKRYTPLVPVGVYCARDQVPEGIDDPVFNEVTHYLTQSAGTAKKMLQDGEVGYMYHTNLGTQFEWEHTLQLNKFIYMGEIRTVPGVHFRYAAHVRSLLQNLYHLHPELKGLVLEGSAEPE